MNPVTAISSGGAKTPTTGWGFPFIPDFSSLWGKYRTSRMDEFDKADGFDVNFPSKPDVASKSDIIETPGPGYEEKSVDNQVHSCLHGILEENAKLTGKRGRKSKQYQDKKASKLYEPPRRSKRLIQNVPKIEVTKADTTTTRFEKKKACISHHSKKLKNESPQAPDNIQCEAFLQSHAFVKQSVDVSHHCDSPTRYIFNCTHCTKVCASKHHLQAHLVAKHNPSPLLCKFCGKLFGTQASLKKHQAYQEACKKVQQTFSQKRKE